jgi:hypothetical protein
MNLKEHRNLDFFCKQRIPRRLRSVEENMKAQCAGRLQFAEADLEDVLWQASLDGREASTKMCLL